VLRAIYLSKTALDTYDAPPKLGEHSHEVLTELLGSEEVAALANAGVV
jgi:crotonobetainyl-CoA:carnitine CoA-transferase CaiB-like acyl-CoA transferase